MHGTYLDTCRAMIGQIEMAKIERTRDSDLTPKGIVASQWRAHESIRPP